MIREAGQGAAGAAGAARTVPFLTDSRAFSDSYDGAMRKINDREALRLGGREWEGDEPVPLEDAERAAADLAARWKTTLFLTRGSRGILVREGAAMHAVPGLQILGRIDTVGAGDSALAGIAAALAAGRGALEAAELGNFVAGVTVQKLFTTGTASPAEVLAIGSDPDYVFAPELAADPRRARFHGATEIEVVTAVPALRRVTHAIFDNDGTISTLREGWERIMEPMMIRAVLGDGWKSAEQRLYRAVEERVRDYIDTTTGIQTLVQMTGLVEMVREFGVVPTSEVLDAKGYKAVYNDELLVMVRGRLAKLERGELSVEDYTLKGALALLADLDRAGVELHLASGTDEPDVRAEAEALGFARWFKGRIHGSIGDVKHEAKRVVLERILADIGPKGTARSGHVRRRSGGASRDTPSRRLLRGCGERRGAEVRRESLEAIPPDQGGRGRRGARLHAARRAARVAGGEGMMPARLDRGRLRFRPLGERKNKVFFPRDAVSPDAEPRTLPGRGRSPARRDSLPHPGRACRGQARHARHGRAHDQERPRARADRARA